MISYRYRCIFIHIPKCGGTSIERALGHHEGHTGRGSQDHRTIRHFQDPAWGAFASLENAAIYLSGFLPRRHANARNAWHADAEQFRDFFKFTVVRDPWSRAYSVYRNVLRDQRHRAAWRVEANTAFGPFVHRFAGRLMLRPQTYWLKDYSGRVDLDYVCRFERLAEDFCAVCERLGLAAMPLPHLLAGETQGWQRAYTPELIDFVADTYCEEIALFGFTFDSATATQNGMLLDTSGG